MEKEVRYGESEQTEYYSGSSRASSFSGGGTIHSGTISEYASGIEADMLTYGPDGVTELDYWLSSRRYANYVATSDPSDVTGHFQMLAISGAGYAVGFLYDTDDSENDVQAGVRPLVEIDLTKAKIVRTGNGTREQPYSIVAK